MPHIHTEPGQHDMTVSAYIIRRGNDDWKCLVHFHKKIEKLMQIGGHIEIDESPWQAVVHEIEEESGYRTDELTVLQFTNDRVKDGGNVLHPLPFSMNTHHVLIKTPSGAVDHYHSDSCYGFIAAAEPKRAVKSEESTDLRWLTLPELAESARAGETLEDVVDIYTFLLSHADGMFHVDSQTFSLDEPVDKSVKYSK